MERVEFLLDYANGKFYINELIVHTQNASELGAEMFVCDLYPQAVQWFKDLVDHGGPAEFEVTDAWHEAVIEVKDGKAAGYRMQWEGIHEADARMLEAWGFDISEDDEDEADCLRCGDGGCPSCRPEWFM